MYNVCFYAYTYVYAYANIYIQRLYYVIQNRNAVAQILLTEKSPNLSDSKYTVINYKKNMNNTYKHEYLKL